MQEVRTPVGNTEWNTNTILESLGPVFQQLPIELVRIILKYLSAQAVCQLSLTSKGFKQLADEKELWDFLCKRDFSSSFEKPKEGDHKEEEQKLRFANFTKYFEEGSKEVYKQLVQNEKSRKEITISVVKANGSCIKYIPQHLKNDRNLVLAAIRNNGIGNS